MDTLDASALRCPLPLLQVKLWLKTATDGQELQLLVSDAGSRQDIPAYLLRMGHGVSVVSDTPSVLTLTITKAP
ncbi:sulfurtransferase TusA family protein [Oceanisphaera pacifica]|uniref:Sulfurtransferase TusA family protein n=1 Tax=Oceanisphaera pacifica TaxID=2818389 RepID=A0ABS3NEH1_9GAMM|nr:sulfurtransferase TusA family protein [Oceanisphaera pacifica]MBO1518892.1 sulfurtransferase TusA family protein [Oceanisphaera pacifica]